MGTVAPTPMIFTQLAVGLPFRGRACDRSPAMRARAATGPGKSPRHTSNGTIGVAGAMTSAAARGPPGLEVVAMERSADRSSARAVRRRRCSRRHEQVSPRHGLGCVSAGRAATRDRAARNRTRARRTELARTRAPCRARVRDDARACRARSYAPRPATASTTPRAARARPGDRCGRCPLPRSCSASPSRSIRSCRSPRSAGCRFYVTHSRYLGGERTDALVASAERLLEAGADPNASYSHPEFGAAERALRGCRDRPRATAHAPAARARRGSG